MLTDLTDISVGPEWSIHQVLTQMDASRRGIVLVLDPEGRLLGTVTDGDMRRAVLAQLDLEQPVSEVLASKANSPFATPITAPLSADRSTFLSVLQEHRIQHLPLVDEDQRVKSLIRMADFVPQQDLSVQSVIMAGGQGLRLRPLTEDLPKPMLPVGGRPLLESILEELTDAGINQINLITNFKKEVISDHFGDGAEFGVAIQYVEEDRPLGTAGSLGLLETANKPLLVINGDIITKVDYRAMLDFHIDNKADMTVAVKNQEFQLPYGVVETDGVRITGISEKPVIRPFVNAGIYLIGPEHCRQIPAGEHYDMTDLIERLIKDGYNVVSFPVHEYWRDIGQHEDYAQVQEDSSKGLIR